MATATQIISQALGLLAIKDPSETISGPELSGALDRLNVMLDALRLDSLTAYSLARVTANVSAATATIGPAGTFVLDPRPVRLELGCFFTSANVSYPIDIIDADTYDRIPVKTNGALGPSVVYFDKAWPAGTLYFYPVPSAAISVTLLVQTQIASFADLTTNVSLPSGYQQFLAYELALELAPDYEVTISPQLMMRAQGAKRAVMRVNSRAPVLRLPNAVAGPRYGTWRY
jgi:hypothetical protein